MPIKAVDNQVLFPKSTEVSRIHSNDQERNSIFQHQQAMSIQKSTEGNTRKVYSQDKANEPLIRDKREQNRDNRKGGGNDKKKNKGSSSSRPNTMPGSIDIRL